MKYFINLIVILFLAASVLADKKCLNCHQSSPPKGMEMAQDVDFDEIKLSVHSDVSCNDCHDIDIAIKHDGNKKMKCGQCHREAEDAYNQSMHRKGKMEKIEQVPDCATCHGGHSILPIENVNSKVNHQNSAQICLTCHKDEKLTEQISNIPGVKMLKAYENSVHGQALLIDGNADAPTCTNCHGSHSFMPPDNPDSPLNKEKIASTCGVCHSQIMAAYNESIHGEMLSKGVSESPTCTNCHGEHDIKTHFDPESKSYSTNVVKTCSECHDSEYLIGKYGIKADRLNTFKESFHGVATELEETKAANCASCHGVHNIFPQSNPKSTINKKNIGQTCGKCHDDLPDDFAQGEIHKSASDKTSGGEFFVRKFYYWFIPLIIIAFILYRILEFKRRVKVE